MMHLSVPVICIHSFLFIFLLLSLETTWPDLCKTNRTFQENLLIWYKFLSHRSPSANVLDLCELSCCLCDSSCLTGLLRNMEFSVIPSKIISFLDIHKPLCTSCQDFLPDWLLQGKCLLLLLPAPRQGLVCQRLLLILTTEFRAFSYQGFYKLLTPAKLS